MKQAAIAHAPTLSAGFNRAVVLFTDGLESVTRKIRYWQVQQSVKKELSELPDSILRDIGTTRCEIPAHAQRVASNAIR